MGGSGDGEGARPLLFTPITLRGVTSRNRIMASPMCQYASIDGGPTDWHLIHLGRSALGGAGIVFHEESAVEPRGRKSHHCAGLYNDAHARAYRRINESLVSLGAVPAIQLGHSGRRASTHGAMEGWRPLTEADAAHGLAPWRAISPSALPAGDDWPTPKEMDRDDIRAVVAAWAEAARRGVDAGFEVCEVHGAHGYLIHQFLSPVSNRRNDAHGGDRAGRMRFALEVAEAVRAAWPDDKPLFFRVSCVDGKGGVWDIADTVTLAAELKERGVDVVDCSSGGINGPTAMALVPRMPGYHVAFAERVRHEVDIATVAGGLITGPDQAEAILQAGQADLIAMARELMYHADWPVHAARALGVADYLDLFPDAYAFRLKRRDEVARLTAGAEDETAGRAAGVIEST